MSRKFEDFASLYDTLMAMAKRGELPAADATEMEDVVIARKSLSPAASANAITARKHLFQSFLDSVQCLESPEARRVVSDFFLDAAEEKEPDEPQPLEQRSYSEI